MAGAMDSPHAQLVTVRTVGINQIRKLWRIHFNLCFFSLRPGWPASQHAHSMLRIPDGVPVWCRWNGNECFGLGILSILYRYVLALVFKLNTLRVQPRLAFGSKVFVLPNETI